MTESGFTTQRLGADDIALARALNAMFATAFGDEQTYLGARPDDGWLVGLLAREEVVVLVARQGDAVVGGLVAYELPKLEQARSEFYLYDLAVDAAHRRRGIATALIGHLRDIAAVRGGWVIFVQGDHGDGPALALYDKLGIREEVLHFDIPVVGSP